MLLQFDGPSSHIFVNRYKFLLHMTETDRRRFARVCSTDIWARFVKFRHEKNYIIFVMNAAGCLPWELQALTQTRPLEQHQMSFTEVEYRN